MTRLDTHIVGWLLALALFAPVAGAATRQQELDRLVTQYQRLRQFNGAVLVADEKGVILKKGYGFANLEWQIPNTPDTKFRIASITKQFTSMLVMQLVAEGKLSLDGKITQYLPDYRKDTGDRVTLTHLLNHTSGIPNYTALPTFEKEIRNPHAVAEFVKTFASGDLEFEPGTKIRYSNSGYFILGAIIEKVTGKPYAQVMRERVFTPLGMKNSGYDVATTVLPKRASGYDVGPDGYVNTAYIDMSLPYAAGGLYSTVEDLYLWDRALYQDTLLPAPLKQRMFTPGLNQYAFGWSVTPFKLHDDKTSLATLNHDGGINGFATLIVRVPERKELVVLLDNTSGGEKREELASGLLSILHGIKAHPPREGIGDVVMATLEKSSVSEAIARYRILKTTKADAYDFSAAQLNLAGYRLLGTGRASDAIEVFKLNVEMFPKDGNAYDSLAEAYMTSGNKELAITNYRRSLELSPGNANAVNMLQKLEAPASTR